MARNTYYSTQEINKNLKLLEGKTKQKIFQNLSNYHDEMNIRRRSGNFQFEDILSKNVRDVGKIYHEVLLLMKCLQTKHQVKSMHIRH